MIFASGELPLELLVGVVDCADGGTERIQVGCLMEVVTQYGL